MRRAFEKLLYAIGDMFIPLTWGVAVGLLVGTGMSTVAEQRAIKQDCEVMGTFRLGDKAFDCIPRKK